MRACVHAQVLCILRVFGVHVIVLVVVVVCLMLVLSALEVLVAVYVYSFRSQFSVVGGILFTPPVGDSKLCWLLPNFDHCNFCTKFLCETHSTSK